MRIFKGLGLFIAIACAVWVGVLWQWQTTRRDMSVEDIVVWLGLLPLTLFVLVVLARWAVDSALRRAAARPPAAATAPAAQAGAAQSAPADAERHATLQLLAAELSVAPAASAGELVAAAQQGKPRPALHPRLRDGQGLPVITAWVADLALEPLEAELAPLQAAVIAARPEWQGRAPSERLRRALALLAEPLERAAQALRPWAGALAEAAAAGDEPARVRVLAGWPEGCDAFELELATRWLARHLAQAGQGVVAPARWQLPPAAATTPASGPQLLLEADQLLAALRREGRADPVLVLACHSDIDRATVDRLDAGGRLFSANTPKGRLPGEGAAVLLLAGSAWPADPAADAAPPVLHRPAVGQRDKSIEAPGRTSSALAAELVQQAAAAAPLELAAVAALASDADQHTARGPELFGAMLETLGHLDASEDLRLAGPLCGHLGACGALVTVAMAAELATVRDQPCLALSVSDAHWRAALVVRPSLPSPPSAVPAAA